VERAEAEAIYAAGREAVVEVLLAMDRRIQLLEARVEQLERRLGRSSRNSSLPPSQDPPGVAPRRRGKDRSGRPPGGQSGHEGHGRELLPAWAVDELVDHWPTRCGCGHAFAEAERVACREPARHQVEELPQIAVHVTEHRCQRVRCPGCGLERSGELPVEVVGSAFGPRLQAAVAALSVRNRVSRRDLVELCEELFGARISIGSIDAILDRAGNALEAPYEQLLGWVRRSRALNVDETGWRLKGAQRTLWGAFTEKIAVFKVTENRHERHLRELLADHTGIVTSDRWWA
jgi:transposase